MRYAFQSNEIASFSAMYVVDQFAASLTTFDAKLRPTIHSNNFWQRNRDETWPQLDRCRIAIVGNRIPNNRSPSLIREGRRTRSITFNVALHLGKWPPSSSSSQTRIYFSSIQSRSNQRIETPSLLNERHASQPHDYILSEDRGGVWSRRKDRLDGTRVSCR